MDTETKPKTGATDEQKAKAANALIRQRCGIGPRDSLSDVPLWQINKADDQVEAVAPHLVPPGYVIVPRSLLDTVRDLLDDAHDPGGSLSGRFAIEGRWQDVENALAEVQP